jgi:hypothetical protein
MIVYRCEFVVKLGKSNEACEMYKSAREQWGTESRILYQRFGPGHLIAMEWEFENLAEYEKWWAEFGADPANVEPMAKMGDVIENWHSQEVWEVID